MEAFFPRFAIPSRLRFLAGSLAAAGSISVGVGQTTNGDENARRPEVLIEEMGCAACHEAESGAVTLRELTPDLSQAGLRYRDSYLYDFLLNPRSVRHHLAAARMPGFHLTGAEAVALTLFLREQRRETDVMARLPSEARNALTQPPGPVAEEAFHALLDGGELRCLDCHQWQGRGGTLGVELAHVGYRLQPEWMKHYLAQPQEYGVRPEVMPPQFFVGSEDGTRSLQEIMPMPTEKIRTLVDFFFQEGATERRVLDQIWDMATSEHAQVTAADGERLFRAFQCAACHRHDRIQPSSVPTAPPLPDLARGVRRDWLTGYLQHPGAIRPAGYQPGQGGRMPDFRLSPEEAQQLSAYLIGLAEEAEPGPDPDFVPSRLSVFSRRKAEQIFTEKLSCTGCHAWQGRGGRMAPELTNVRERLLPARIRNVIRDPRQAVPHSIMPRVPMTEATADLIVGLLCETTEANLTNAYLSPLEHPSWPWLGESGPSLSSADHYRRFCAGCHGEQGGGDGFNAPFLPVRPTIHADAVFMSGRPDDTLFDGIHAGGAILNKSHLMPPWGEALSSAETRGLVKFLRELCHCQGPAWSRDPRSP